jgi:hypothetical protein
MTNSDTPPEGLSPIPDPPEGSPAWEKKQKEEARNKDAADPLHTSQIQGEEKPDETVILPLDSTGKIRDDDTLSLPINETREAAAQAAAEKVAPLTDIKPRGSIVTKWINKGKTNKVFLTKKPELQQEGASKKIGHTREVLPTIKSGESMLEKLGIEKALLRENGFGQQAFGLCENRFPQSIILEVLEYLLPLGVLKHLSAESLESFKESLHDDKGLMTVLSLLSEIMKKLERGSELYRKVDEKALAKIRGAIALMRITKLGTEQNCILH